ncbi:hypothetical protein COU61_03635 [Candidatus Pacearchaeota archaeon CG10_big_fil_rev_8_21_14_0_10_35_13]|nr:MAG: hypothetical protein COU61_03635 [Candidatus Pacearchaeota archaeon CG10_big_fil_rev_8_21_14_0_10_35_13]
MGQKTIKKEFEGTSPPAVFIGSKLKYPEVNIGVLSLGEINEEAWEHNAPNHWSEKNEKIERILELRQGLINSKTRTTVKEIRKNNKLLRKIQEVGMATIKADMEIKLKKPPIMKIMKYDQHVMPIGISAKLESLKEIGNLKIPTPVEKIYDDTDMKSAEGIMELYKKGFNEQELTQILSIGVTGLGKNRKLVPTRNSITAVDDLIGRRIIKEILNYETIDKPRIYQGGHLGNYYTIIMIPGIWNYELFETSIPSGKTTTDHETHRGRKNYAEETEGGYYAARIGILEYLKKIKKQATTILYRITTPEYTTPLGVWVCRNSVRKALQEEKKEYETNNETIERARMMIKEKWGYDIKELINKSKIIKLVRTQKRITEWF